LCAFSRRMDLFKDDVLFWSVQRSPAGHMPPQRAILRGAVAIRMLFARAWQTRSLTAGVAFELLDHKGASLPRRGSNGFANHGGA
jgi:hypothetical protein